MQPQKIVIHIVGMPIIRKKSRIIIEYIDVNNAR